MTVAPAIVSADFSDLADEVRRCGGCRLAIEAGANAIVAGSAIFGSHCYAAAIAVTREARRLLARRPRA
jgi:pentose-5-phosphate-3-epimerase